MTFTGVYNKTLFRNEKNGYTIFFILSRDCDEFKNVSGYIVCTGKIPIYTKGIPLRLEGEFVPDKKGGYKFEVQSVEEYFNDRSVTISFIINAGIPGIGPKVSEKIVDYVGSDILSFAQKDNAGELLSTNVQGITNEIARDFIKTIKNTTLERTLYQQICRYGCEYIHAARLIETYGSKAKKRLFDNCYTVGMETGIPFATCDEIAKSLSKPYYDEERIKSLLIYSMRLLSSAGHIYSQITDISDTVNQIVKNSAFVTPIPEPLLIRAAYTSKNVIIENPDNPIFSLSEYRTQEINIVKNVKRINNCAEFFYIDDGVINKAISEAENTFKIKYSEKQKQSFNFIKSSGIKILTGGPGTGKTTVINGLIYAYKKIFPDKTVTLCAPTGRAAQRMSESTGIKANTIHRLLNIKPYGNEITCKDQSSPLETDFLIVDEMSMTDNFVFSLLMGAVKNGALILLCGDVDQLPAVGPGNILNDMINSQLFDVNKLDVIYRQSNTSSIIANAIKINKGDTSLDCDENFKIIKVHEADEIQEIIKKITSKYYTTENPFSMQVLTTVKRGLLGVYDLNVIMQNIANPSSLIVGYGVNHYRIKDKIMMVKNNYDINYVNGDLGIIKKVMPTAIVAEVNNEEMIIPKKDLQDIMLAYSATIHKSQGSEYDIAVIVLPKYPSCMLRRNLLYTAVTRAKRKVIIISQKEALDKAISCVDNTARRTLLSQRLNDCKIEFVK